MIDYLHTERKVQALKQQLACGQIDRQRFRQKLVEMIDYDHDGYYRMIGYETGLWYRYTGKQWVVDRPGQQNSQPASAKKHPHPPSSDFNGPQVKWENIEWGYFLFGVVGLGVVGTLIFMWS